MTVMYTMVM